MARQVGDLWPYASGSASLGAEQISGQGGFSHEIRPFAHVHQNSGIFHSPVGGTSGVVRYSDPAFGSPLYEGFEFSFDGGTTFPFAIIEEDGSTGRIRWETTRRLATESLNRQDLIEGSWVVQLLDALPITGTWSVIAAGNIQQTTSRNFDLNASEQIDFAPWSGSGRLSYEFGPHEAWHTTVGAGNTDLVPIPHSGHVLQMILENSVADVGLQDAYDVDNSVYLDSLNLTIESQNGKTVLAPGGGRAAVSLSGTFVEPTVDRERGDLYVMNHSDIFDSSITSQAQADAMALGLATPCFETGSGVINLMVGSGVIQYLNNGAQTLTTTFAATEITNAFPISDANYTLDASTHEVTFMSPGLYKCTYKILSTKTAGATPQFCEHLAQYNGSNVLGSFISSFHFDTSASQGSATATTIINADAGGTFNLMSRSSLQGANSCQISARGCILVIEKIGPKRT